MADQMSEEMPFPLRAAAATGLLADLAVVAKSCTVAATSAGSMAEVMADCSEGVLELSERIKAWSQDPAAQLLRFRLDAAGVKAGASAIASLELTMALNAVVDAVAAAQGEAWARVPPAGSA